MTSQNFGRQDSALNVDDLFNELNASTATHVVDEQKAGEMASSLKQLAAAGMSSNNNQNQSSSRNNLNQSSLITPSITTSVASNNNQNSTFSTTTNNNQPTPVVEKPKEKARLGKGMFSFSTPDYAAVAGGSVIAPSSKGLPPPTAASPPPVPVPPKIVNPPMPKPPQQTTVAPPNLIGNNISMTVSSNPFKTSIQTPQTFAVGNPPGVMSGAPTISTNIMSPAPINIVTPMTSKDLPIPPYQTPGYHQPNRFGAPTWLNDPRRSVEDCPDISDETIMDLLDAPRTVAIDVDREEQELLMRLPQPPLSDFDKTQAQPVQTFLLFDDKSIRVKVSQIAERHGLTASDLFFEYVVAAASAKLIHDVESLVAMTKAKAAKLVTVGYAEDISKESNSRKRKRSEIVGSNENHLSTIGNFDYLRIARDSSFSVLD